MPSVDWVVPSRIGSIEVENALLNYLANKAYLPTSFVLREARTEARTFFAPIYLLNYNWSVTWHASFGYDQQVNYTEYQRKEVNGRVYQEPVTKTKTVVDWRPASGHDEGSKNLVCYAGSYLPIAGIAVVERVDLTGAVKPDSFIGDIEPFHLSSEDAIERVRPRAQVIVEASIKRHAQGDHSKDWTWSGSHKFEEQSIYVSISHFDILYKNKHYGFWIDCSDTCNLKHDKLPRDQKKLLRMVAGFTPSTCIGGFGIYAVNENLVSASGTLMWTLAIGFIATTLTAIANMKLLEKRGKRQLATTAFTSSAVVA